MHAVDDYSCNYDFFFFLCVKQAARHQSQTFSSLTPSTCDYTPLPADLNHSLFENERLSRTISSFSDGFKFTINILNAL